MTRVHSPSDLLERFSKLLRIAAVALVLSILAACNANVALYSAAPEAEANELVAALLDAGIPAKKSPGKDGVAVEVPAADVGRALDTLRARGLPKERFDGMGQIFRREGLVSSPLEERARYVYALSQELANTLSKMDGVLIARVHVVLPERGGIGEPATASTAAVFIKHQAGYSLDALAPQIRKLVTHAIPSLTEERVSIALIEAQPGLEDPVSPAEAQAAPRLKVMVLMLAAVVIVLLAFIVYLFLRGRRSRAAHAATPPGEKV